MPHAPPSSAGTPSDLAGYIQLHDPGRPVALDRTSIPQIRDGQCIERSPERGHAGLLQQVGALPEPA